MSENQVPPTEPNQNQTEQPPSTGNTPEGASLTPSSKPSDQASLTPNGKSQAAPPVKTPNQTVVPTKWMDSLPDDLKQEKTLQNFKGVEDVARALIAAKKFIGSDKIHVPDPTVATDEDYRNVFVKLGLPEDVKEYKVDLPPEHGLDNEFLGKLQEVAHKTGILPKQLQSVLRWYSDESKEVIKAHNETLAEERKQAAIDLHQEWGKGFRRNELAAQLALRDAASPEQIKYLEEKGLASDPVLLRIFSKIGNMTKEKELRGGSGPSNDLTPSDAKDRAFTIMSDFKHPYNDRNHPNHKRAVDEVSRLMSMAHPEDLSA